MFKMGIIDPAKVARTALLNAASVSGLALTTDVLITELKEKKGERAQPVAGGGRFNARGSPEREIEPRRHEGTKIVGSLCLRAQSGAGGSSELGDAKLPVPTSDYS